MPPYRGYDKRWKNYDLSVIPDNVRAKFDARKSAMVEGQQEMQAEIVDVETKVREKLDENGIIANIRVMYLNYARALIRAKGHNSGLALRKVAAAEKAKFVQYGLDATLLDEITYIVIGAPVYV